MRIRPSINAREILKIQPDKKLAKKLTGFFLSFLEKYFGSEILLNIPDVFLNMPTEFVEIANRFSDSTAQDFIIRNTKISRLPDEPFVHRFITEINGKGLGGGADLFDEKKALWKSLAESIERYLWFSSDYFFKDKVHFFSYREIEKKALNIFDLAGFSKKQKEKFFELQFNESTRFGWIKTTSLTTGNKKYCPVQLLSNRYFQENVKRTANLNKSEPMLRWSVSTGLATGRSLEEAITKGVLETIERDAFMISYLNKISPPTIDIEYLASQDTDMMKILRMMRRYKLNFYLIKLPSDFPVNVILTIIYDDTEIGPALTVGASADFDIKNCILDSVSECLSIRQSLRKELETSSEKDNFDSENSDIDRKSRLFYWSKKENKSKLDFLIRGKAIQIDITEGRDFFCKKEIDWKSYYSQKLHIIKSVLKKNNYEAVYADLTTPEIKTKGLRCVQVVIPQLQPMHLIEKIPYLEGKRLRDIPLKLGYNSAKELNKYPHPFP